MAFKVPNMFRVRKGIFGSDDNVGNNGKFKFPLGSYQFTVVASDGMGWEHVSVSTESRCPHWHEMCIIKDMFWGKDDPVIQFHPPEKDYVNFHPHCLHLWRSTNFKFPLPDPILVGPK